MKTERTILSLPSFFYLIKIPPFCNHLITLSLLLTVHDQCTLLKIDFYIAFSSTDKLGYTKVVNYKNSQNPYLNKD